MAHTQHNHPRTPSAAPGRNEKQAEPRTRSQADPERGRASKATSSADQRAPQAASGKRKQ
jgi:hypothetical protein